MNIKLLALALAVLSLIAGMAKTEARHVVKEKRTPKEEQQVLPGAVPEQQVVVTDPKSLLLKESNNGGEKADEEESEEQDTGPGTSKKASQKSNNGEEEADEDIPETPPETSAAATEAQKDTEEVGEGANKEEVGEDANKEEVGEGANKEEIGEGANKGTGADVPEAPPETSAAATEAQKDTEEVGKDANKGAPAAPLETPAEAATTPEAPAVATEAAATPEAAAVPEAPAIPDIPNIAKINIRSGIYSPIQLSSAQSVQTLGNNSVIRVMINLPNPVLKEVNGSYDKSDETINLTPIINPDVVPYIASGRELFQALLSKVSVSPDDRQILEGVAVDQPDMADLKDLKVKPEFQTIWERLNNIPLFCIITFYIKDNVVERVEMTVSKAVKLFIMERDTINKKIRKAVEQYKSTVENLNYDVKDLEVVEAAMEKVKTLEAEMKTYLEEKEKVGQELENGPAVQKRKNALEGLEEEKKKRAEELATENKQLINAKESVGKDDGSSSAKKEEEIKKAEKKVADAEDEFGKAKKAAADAEIKAKAPKPTDRRGRPLSGFENVDKDYDAALSAQTAAENKFKRLQEELEAIRNTKTGPSKEEIEEKMSKIEEKLKANEKARADLEEEITRRSQEIEEEYNNDEELKSLRARLEVINSEMESKKEELSELRKKTEDKVTQLETLQHLRQVRSRKLNEELETECKRIDKELEGLEGIVKKSGGAAQEVALTLAAVGVATNGNSRDVAQSVNTLLSDPEQRKGIEEVAEGDKVLQIQAKNIVAALKNKDTNKE